MPIRINLKELFASDAQEMFIDKTNFNFNKLLELGIGDQGIQGIAGPTGSAGPSGNTGDDGQRGNKWFVGIGVPTSQTFVDLIENDFYLDTSISSIWQYQGSPATWIEIADLSEVVTNLIVNEGAPFVRGFGEFSPLDDRYILFTHRGNDVVDIAADISLGNTSNNDILLLNNWNERVTDIVNFPLNTDDEYNAIQQLSIDQSTSTLGRYHLELSSLYIDPASPSDILLSSLNHNLKVKYTKTSGSSLIYPNSNKFINTSSFNLSIPPTGIPVDITEQGIFEFVVPKFIDNEPIGIVANSNVFMKFGTTESLSETSDMDTPLDGLEITSDFISSTISIGLIRGLDEFNSILTLNPNLYGNFGMIDISDDLNGLMIKGDTYHTGGSLTHIQTDSNYSSNWMKTYSSVLKAARGHQGICSTGKYLFVVSPLSNVAEPWDNAGFLNIWDISNIEDPKNIHQQSGTSEIQASIPSPPGIEFDNHRNPDGLGPYTNYPGLSAPNYTEFMSGLFLTGARDIAFKGKYGVMVRYKPTPPGTFPPYVFYDTFQIFEINSDGSELQLLSWLGTNNTFAQKMYASDISGAIPEMDFLRRVEIHGSYAVCMSSMPNPTGISDSSHIMMVDITNPTNPWISTVGIKETIQSQHVDFDIENETAYIISYHYTGADYEVNLIKQDISNPTALTLGVTPSNTQTIEAAPIVYSSLMPTAGIKAIGKRLYITYDNWLRIYDINNKADANAALMGGVYIPQATELCDIEIKGDYAYIYGQDVSSEATLLITVDISDSSAPFVLTPVQTFDPNIVGNNSPSKMTMVGDKIFTISAKGTLADAGVSVIDIPSIKSSAGNIGSLRSDSINVTDSIDIGKTLNVGNSAVIGSGGLWVDRGNGVHVDGPVVSTGGRDINYIYDVFGRRQNFTAITSDGQPGFFGNISYSARYNKINMQSTAYSTGLDVTFDDVDVGIFGSAYGVKIDYTGISGGAYTYGIYINGEDYNYLSGDLEVDGDLEVGGDLDVVGKINGSFTQNGPGQIIVTLDDNILASGRADLTGGSVLWQRVGNIVTVTGQCNNITSSRQEVPLIGPSGSHVNMVGHGISNMSVSGTTGIEVRLGSSPVDEVEFICAVSPFVLRTTGTTRFTYSYRLT